MTGLIAFSPEKHLSVNRLVGGLLSSRQIPCLVDPSRTLFLVFLRHPLIEYYDMNDWKPWISSQIWSLTKTIRVASSFYKSPSSDCRKYFGSESLKGTKSNDCQKTARKPTTWKHHPQLVQDLHQGIVTGTTVPRFGAIDFAHWFFPLRGGAGAVGGMLGAFKKDTLIEPWLQKIHVELGQGITYPLLPDEQWKKPWLF